MQMHTDTNPKNGYQTDQLSYFFVCLIAKPMGQITDLLPVPSTQRNEFFIIIQ